MNENQGETISGDAPYEFSNRSPVEEANESSDPVRVEDAGEELQTPETDIVDYRSAETGQFVTEDKAEESPETTVRETRPTTMSKKRTVMERDLDAESGNFINFTTKDDTSGYLMNRDDWNDFGQPHIITVAVVPRDILN